MFAFSFSQVPCFAEDKRSQLYQNNVMLKYDRTGFSKGPFVYGFIDLFIGSGESWHWGLAVEESNGLHPNKVDRSNKGYGTLEKKIAQNPLVIKDTKQGPLGPTEKLDPLEEESKAESKNTNSSSSSYAESGNGSASVVNTISLHIHFVWTGILDA